MEKIHKNRQEFLLEQLETLFKFVPPVQLKRTLDEVYGIYLVNVENLDFKDIAMDMYFLNKFLESMQDLQRSNSQ